MLAVVQASAFVAAVGPRSKQEFVDVAVTRPCLYLSDAGVYSI